jgi:hypothetical protein
VSRGEAWALHGSLLLVGASGLVLGWMLYLLEPADEFALWNHPWQGHLLHLHVFTAPLFVFASGLLWVHHVWAKWRAGARTRRRSGLSLALTLAPLVLSGYGIQVTVDEAWRRTWIWVHVTTGVLWLVLYLVHQLSGRGRPPAQSAP